MSPDSLSSDLLLRWEEARERGQDLSAEELCAEHPELAGELDRLIRALRSLAPLLEDDTPSRESGAAGSAPAPPLGGVPGYEILGELGRGGMGVVYKARQVRLNRVVALKVILRGPYASSVDRARFQAEAEAVAQLHHPNIVQVYEVGEHEGLPWLVLEYVPGATLAEWLPGRPVPPSDAAALVETLARAVDHAHRRGIVHRDLKPTNVLLSLPPDSSDQSPTRSGCSEDGAEDLSAAPLARLHPRVVDFGLAKRLDSRDGLTQTGVVLGSPSYMAPEQAAGKGREVGPATDVYALGAILYELLTGRPPFQGDSRLETVQQVLTEEPVAPRRLRPRLGPDLETVCLKCLQKKPADRYTTAAELADDLARFLRGDPVRARRPSPFRLAARWVRRHPTAATQLLSALVLAVGLVVAGTVLVGAKLESREAAARAELRLTHQYAAHMRLASQALENGDVFLLSNLLDRYQPTSAAAPDHLGFEYRLLRSWAHPGRQSARAYEELVSWLDYSPDGRFLVTAGSAERRYWKVWDARTGERLKEGILNATPADSGPLIAFSPGDPSLLAVCGDHTIVQFQLPVLKEWRARLEHAGQARAVAIAADGRVLTGGVGPVAVWNGTTGARRLFSHESQGAHRLASSPDGQTVVTFHPPSESPAGDEPGEPPVAYGRIRIWNVETGEPRGSPEPATTLRCLTWSPGGSLLATVDALGQVRLRDRAGVPHQNWCRDARTRATTLAVSPDDRILVVGGEDGSLVFWDVATRTSSARLRWQPSPVSCLGFRPDGKGLAVGTRDGMVSAIPGQSKGSD